MSTRSRAVPWFLERPELLYRPRQFALTTRDRALAASAPVKAWLEEVTRIISQHIAHEWSWNGRTWFDTRGEVVEHEPSDLGPVLELIDEEYRRSQVAMYERAFRLLS